MSLQKMIDEKLREDFEKKRERSGKFSPYLLGRCYRNQIWNKADEPKSNPPDDRALRIFKCGHIFHDYMQQFLPTHQVEVPCENDEFKGRADIVTDDTVYDIKTVHSFSFWYSKKDGYDVTKEKYHNWLQLAYYANHLNKEKMCLVLISKDDMCIDEYIQYTDKWTTELKTEVEHMKCLWANYTLVNKTIPEARPRFNKECKYCDYIDKCKGVEKDGHREHPYDKLLADSKSKRKSRKS